jgi:hypothetical protein
VGREQWRQHHCCAIQNPQELAQMPLSMCFGTASIHLRLLIRFLLMHWFFKASPSLVDDASLFLCLHYVPCVPDLIVVVLASSSFLFFFLLRIIIVLITSDKKEEEILHVTEENLWITRCMTQTFIYSKYICSSSSFSFKFEYDIILKASRCEWIHLAEVPPNQ